MKIPAGTTEKQWAEYHQDVEEHKAYQESIKPNEKDFTDVFGVLDESAYNQAIKRWQFERLLGAPNEPGYYRANND